MTGYLDPEETCLYCGCVGKHHSAFNCLIHPDCGYKSHNMDNNIMIDSVAGDQHTEEDDPLEVVEEAEIYSPEDYMNSNATIPWLDEDLDDFC